MTLLDKLRELDKSATAGEWWYTRCYGVAFIESKTNKSIAKAVEYLKVPDADLICLLRNNLGAFLELADAAENYGTAWTTRDPQVTRDNLTEARDGVFQALSKLKGEV